MKTKRPTQQIYSNYTKQDFEVWKTLFNRQLTVLKPIVSIEYLNALNIIKFMEDKIPDFQEVNAILEQTTSWSLEVVPNISEQKDFFNFLSQKKFTTTCWLRTMEQLDYLEEPDMFHDVFGHVPLLTNQPLCNFLSDLSKIALKHIDNDLAIELIGRLYWFTVEFGLIQEKEGLRIYGAGILSSSGETDYSLFSDVPERVPYDVATILDTPYIKDKYQVKYFIIDSFEQLYGSVAEIDRLVDIAVKENKVLVY